MADVRAPPPPAQDEPEECLHCAIVDMVEERIAGGVDVADLTALIAESLVDRAPPPPAQDEPDECLHCAVILLVPEGEQAKLMAHTLSALGDLFLQKSGAEEGGSGSRH